VQDRYAGDVGDFGKIGMLRQIASTGLRIGINWYRTFKPGMIEMMESILDILATRHFRDVMMSY